MSQTITPRDRRNLIDMLAAHIRLLHVVRFALVFAIAGCVHEPVDRPYNAEKSPIQEREIEYIWLNEGSPAGEQTVVVNSDGSRVSDMRIQWNNRDFILHNEMTLNDDGYVATQHLTGTSAFGAEIDESFSLTGNVARWKNPSEEGEKEIEQPAFYIPARSGATETMAALVRVALNSPDGSVPLLPTGRAVIKEVAQDKIKIHETLETVTLYSISGLEFSPIYVWLDANQELFVFSFWGLSLAPKGMDLTVRNRLLDRQVELEEGYYNAIAKKQVNAIDGALLIENVDIVDVLSGTLREKQYVLSEHGRIVQISDTPIESTRQTVVIDGTSMTMIPGLWDMHAHTTFYSGYGGLFNIASGVTTTRDMGGDPGALAKEKESYAAGDLIGPRIYAAGFIDKKSPFAAARAVETLEEAKERVRAYAEQGYVQIKLYSSIAPEWVEPLASLAHELGMRVGGHIPAFMNAEQAILSGFDEIQHINFLFLNFLARKEDDTRTRLRFYRYGDEAGNLELNSEDVDAFVALLAEQKTVVDPTIAVFDSMIGHRSGEPNPLFGEMIERFPVSEYRSALAPGFDINEGNEQAWQNSRDASLKFLRKLYDSGVTIVAGTDALPGFAMHRELELYAKAGIPNADILRIATIGAASVLNKDDTSGSIDVGKDADMILLDGNPLENISAVRNIHYVISRDRIYQPDALLEAAGVRPKTALR